MNGPANGRADDPAWQDQPESGATGPRLEGSHRCPQKVQPTPTRASSMISVAGCRPLGSARRCWSIPSRRSWSSTDPRLDPWDDPDPDRQIEVVRIQHRDGERTARGYPGRSPIPKSMRSDRFSRPSWTRGVTNSHLRSGPLSSEGRWGWLSPWWSQTGPGHPHAGWSGVIGRPAAPDRLPASGRPTDRPAPRPRPLRRPRTRPGRRRCPRASDPLPVR